MSRFENLELGGDSEEREHYREKPPVKDEAYYVIEFRKPFCPAGGGYIKTFNVNKRTGEVTRGLWRLGR